MIEIEDQELGQRIVDNSLCACGGRLSLAWGGAYGVNSYVIICGADRSHDKIQPVKSFYRMWKDGEPIPLSIQNALENKFRREFMEQEQVQAIVVKQDRGKLAKIVQAQFPQDLTDKTADNFAAFCIAHQLEPITECVPYHGTPYIRVVWFDRQAAQDPKFKGYSYKVLGKEQKENLDFDPKDLVVECHADFEGLNTPLVGLGIIRQTERNAESKNNETPDEVTGRGYRAPVVHTHPQEMLFKRGRSAALRQRYHPPAPILEELPYTVVVETTAKVVPPRQISQKSGDPDRNKMVNDSQRGDPAENPPTEQPSAGSEPKENVIVANWEKFEKAVKKLNWESGIRDFLLERFNITKDGSLLDAVKMLDVDQQEQLGTEVKERIKEIAKSKVQ